MLTPNNDIRVWLVFCCYW